MYTTNLFCRADNRSFRNTDLTPKAVRHKVTKREQGKFIIYIQAVESSAVSQGNKS